MGVGKQVQVQVEGQVDKEESESTARLCGQYQGAVAREGPCRSALACVQAGSRVCICTHPR